MQLKMLFSADFWASFDFPLSSYTQLSPFSFRSFRVRCSLAFCRHHKPDPIEWTFDALL